MAKDIFIPPSPLNLSTIYNKVFGTVAVPFPFPRTLAVTKTVSDEDFTPELNPKLSDTRPLSGDFEFTGMTGNEYFLPTSLGMNDDEYFQLPNEPIISIRGGKMIKSTNIRRGSGSGSVTEERALKPAEIIIRGICINEETFQYPEEQVTTIRRLCEASGVRYVKNYLASLWGIEKVTIHDWNFMRRGNDTLQMQPYMIKMRQDLDFDDFNAIINGEQQ